MRLGVEVLRRSDSVGAPSQNPETAAGGGGGIKFALNIVFLTGMALL